MIWTIPEADFDAINAELDEGIRVGWVREGLYLVDDTKTGFDAAVLAATGESTLDDYLAASGTEYGFQIGKYVGQDFYKSPPMDLDFKTQLTQRLFPVPAMAKGEVNSITYYEKGVLQQDGSVQYSVPVIKETFAYLRTDAGLAVMRNHYIQWYRANGDLDTDPANTKTLVKFYNNIEMLEESERRRKNVVDNAGIGLVFLLDMTEDPADKGTPNIDKARKLWQQYEREIHLYITVGIRDLVESILEDDLFGWLDNLLGGGATVRSWAVNELDIWSE